MSQSTDQDVDTNVMLFRCIEVVGARSDGDRSYSDFFGSDSRFC